MSFHHGLYSERFEKDSCGIGLIVNARVPAQHKIVSQGLQILARLAHRSALGADGKTSDGAGISIQIPDAFFRSQIKLAEGVDLPSFGDYAVAQVFVPKGALDLDSRNKIADKAQELNLPLLCWRTVPVCSDVLGPLALVTEPETVQIFFDFKNRSRKNLFIFRRWLESTFRKYSSCRDPNTGETLSQHYVCSLSNDNIVYKGLMQPADLAEYYPDLKNQSLASQYAMVHSRFSTNTLPAWELAQPFRFSCHNGEINTINGNRQWMKTREFDFFKNIQERPKLQESSLLSENRSDSTSFDETIELLLLSRYSLVEAMMILIPEPWEHDLELSKSLKYFYEFHSFRMEAWDGPAAFCFTDENKIGARLDRNGLRPCRFQILDDGTFVASSEAGVVDAPSESILFKGRLNPGQIILVDLKTGEIDLTNKGKTQAAVNKPYEILVQQERLMPLETKVSHNLLKKMSAWPMLARFGYHYDEILHVILPMFQNKEEATSSMGADTPLALLSDRPQLLTSYFRQLFAQVTNPPIDPIRESSVMSLTSFLGSRASIFSRQSDDKKRWTLAHPFLNRQQMLHVRSWIHSDANDILKTATVLAEFDLRKKNLADRIQAVCEKAELLALNGCEILIISDRNIHPDRAAIPILLLTSAVNSYLIQKQLRMNLSLVIESGEVRDVHQMACLLSFGADAIHPYLVEELCAELHSRGHFTLAEADALNNYYTALKKGVLKVISKLGISTIQSYRGAQTFEILGLHESVANRYFPGVVSRIGGLDLNDVIEETKRRWQIEGEENYQELTDLKHSGDVHYRKGGEKHSWNPSAISKLQRASRENNQTTYKEFSDEVKKTESSTLRGHLKYRPKTGPIPLSDVEPAIEIVKRFTTGAMSLGALSSEAHETLATAMNRIGGKSNSGEGGEDKDRFASSKNSMIKQIASGRFGVTAEYLNSARELQIKMAQGAKPGEGGQLPGHKVNEEIARLRHSVPGVTLISPPPHHDIYSIEDLAQLIYDLRSVNPKATISVKLVSEAGVGTIAAGVVKAMADKILISGDGGGTGASPLSSIRHAGLPWELGLSETHQTLIQNGLRSRVKIEVDGQLRTGRDVAWAAILGAEEFGFATAPLIVEGCIMMRKCHLNTCPVGVATQDPLLRKKFSGQPEHVINYFFFVAEELREIMSSLGIAKLSDLVGRVDLLEFNAPMDHWKARGLNLENLISPAKAAVVNFGQKPENEISTNDFSKKIQAVKNTDRALGTWLSGEVIRRNRNFWPMDIKLNGSAGQSLGAFLSAGITLRLVGEANDYVGKGLCGGRILLRFDERYVAEMPGSVIAGNTCLYGATSGYAFIAGHVGERFAVRNSGATAVVEGVGNHGCEYMTGGCVVILGPVGKNFAAGMSGGQAFVFDEDQELKWRYNKASVEIDELSSEDEHALLALLNEHLNETGSAKAKRILAEWDFFRKYFKVVVAHEYKSILNRRRVEVHA